MLHRLLKHMKRKPVIFSVHNVRWILLFKGLGFHFMNLDKVLRQLCSCYIQGRARKPVSGRESARASGRRLAGSTENIEL